MPLSLDEFMARFGAAIHRHGRLLAPVAPAWRPYVAALQPQFLFATPDGALWTSSYLPINAALRALGGLIGAESLVSPGLAALSLAAVYGVGRKLWPERRSTALVAVILLATSSQWLLTAMTPYAMTAHLALNMVWLWLFLRGGRSGHAGAIVVGFLACGLHQLVFHPLFVAPFILQAWLERRRRLAGLYTLAYAAICLFWIEYWPLAVALSGAGAVAAHATPAAAPIVGGAIHGFGDHILALLHDFSGAGFGLMAKNLIRFAVWQNPLMIALLVVGAAGAIRTGGAPRALLAGLILAPLAMLFLLPYQGHGWGYRYLHGFLGSAALIAAQAWTSLADVVPPDRRPAARVGFVAAAAASLLLLFPLHAWQAHAFVEPYAEADAAIRRAGADIVLLDDDDAWFTADLVRNDPWLTNRPVVLLLGGVTEQQVAALCAQHSIALFDARVAARHGIRVVGPPSPALAGRLAAIARLACGPARLPVREVD